MTKGNDTILCSDKKDAMNCISNIGAQYIDDWEFLPEGKVRIYLNCKLSEIGGST